MRGLLLKKCLIALIVVVTVEFVGCKKDDLPSLSKPLVSQITQNTAHCYCEVTDDGGSDISSYGICWSTSSNPTIVGDNIQMTGNLGVVSVDISGFVANTAYYIRGFAKNSKGIGYSKEVTFKTLQPLGPVVKSLENTNITTTSANCGIELITNGGTPTKWGICWSTHENPTIADNKIESPSLSGKSNCLISNLEPNTIFYWRAYAENLVDTVYGEIRFARTMYSTVTDVDGNSYYTVLIGSQEWMAENLKVNHYSNGETIINVSNETSWNSASFGACCAYFNVPSNGNTYGLIYNYHTISDSRGLCPTGWHVPSYSEWSTLITFLGGLDIAGYKMKKKVAGFLSDNSSGFTALLAGYRDYLGSYFLLGYSEIWWSSTFSGPLGIQYYAIKIYHNEDSVIIDKLVDNYGGYIRCIKD